MKECVLIPLYNYLEILNYLYLCNLIFKNKLLDLNDKSLNKGQNLKIYELFTFS